MHYDDYYKIIISMVKILDDSDIRFMNQLYISLYIDI